MSLGNILFYTILFILGVVYSGFFFFFLLRRYQKDKEEIAAMRFCYKDTRGV